MSALGKIIVSSQHDTALAAESRRILAKLRPDTSLTVQIDGEAVALPKEVFGLLSKILTEMAAGNAVKIFPVDAQLTTQEAADYLNVSRPYLIKLIEAKELRCSKVGRHRRVNFQELQAYKAEKTAAIHRAVAEPVM